MGDDSIDVSNIISNVVRAVGAMNDEFVIFLFFYFFICINWVY